MKSFNFQYDVQSWYMDGNCYDLAYHLNQKLNLPIYVIYSSYRKDKNIILVDDVITTGSTILECSKVLKNAGCGDVYVCSLALAE